MQSCAFIKSGTIDDSNATTAANVADSLKATVVSMMSDGKLCDIDAEELLVA